MKALSTKARTRPVSSGKDVDATVTPHRLSNEARRSSNSDAADFPTQTVDSPRMSSHESLQGSSGSSSERPMERLSHGSAGRRGRSDFYTEAQRPRQDAAPRRENSVPMPGSRAVTRIKSREAVARDSSGFMEVGSLHGPSSLRRPHDSVMGTTETMTTAGIFTPARTPRGSEHESKAMTPLLGGKENLDGPESTFMPPAYLEAIAAALDDLQAGRKCSTESACEVPAVAAAADVPRVEAPRRERSGPSMSAGGARRFLIQAYAVTGTTV